MQLHGLNWVTNPTLIVSSAMTIAPDLRSNRNSPTSDVESYLPRGWRIFIVQLGWALK